MRLFATTLTLGLLSVLGCGSEPKEMMMPPPGGCNLTSLPAAYDGAGYAANSATEQGIRTRLKAFLQPMKDAEANLMVKPTEAQLKALFAEGSSSVRAITTSYYVSKVEGWIAAFAAAAGNTWMPAATPMGPGGKFGSYIFSAQGTDLRQAIEKGLFAAALYHHGLGLMNGPITAATLDRLIAIYGAHPSFPRDDKAMQNPDEFIAVYAKRRDKGDPQNPGPYLRIKGHFIRAQAAIAAGAACNAERDMAVQAIRAEWERVLLSTVIYYLNDVSKKLGAPSPSMADQANALHGYGEAVGFVHGFRQLPAAGRTITDAQVDELLALLGAPAEGPATSYKLITETAAMLPRLTQAITRIAAIYGFTAQQVEDFKTNY
jgi:hypothetical protein